MVKWQGGCHRERDWEKENERFIIAEDGKSQKSEPANEQSNVDGKTESVLEWENGE